MSATKTRILPKTAWSAPKPWQPSLSAFAMLILALSVFGLGEALIIRSDLGASPWTVLALGLANHLPLSIGMITFLISVAVFLGWLPLKMRAGLGTLCNIVVIALALDAALALIATPETLLAKTAFCITGVVLIGVASGFYLTCQMGAGPRDGLMVGICQRFGWRVGVVRAGIEVSVCTVGWLLGGTVGIGTLLFAFGVGYVVQSSLSMIKKYASICAD